jgi:hypothetical protein
MQTTTFRRLIYVAILLLALVAWPSRAVATTIWANTGVGGVGVTPTFGEAFVVPALDSHLTEFAFFLSGGAADPFDAYIYEWSVASRRAVGSALWSSAGQVGGPPQYYSFSPDIDLVPGGAYVAFFHCPQGCSSVSPQFGTQIAEAQGVFFQGPPADWTTAVWRLTEEVPFQPVIWDLYSRFTWGPATATPGPIAPVPEPISLLIVGTGLAASALRRAGRGRCVRALGRVVRALDSQHTRH